jgi:hypothetical protein
VRRDANHEHARGCGSGGQPGKQSVAGIPIQVDEQPFADEERGLSHLMTSPIEHRANIIGAEIDLGQRDVTLSARLPQQPRLVILSRRMVQLDKPHSRSAEAQRAVVVPCPADDHLPQPGRDRSHDLVVHEPGPGRDARLQPPRRTEPHVLTQHALRVRIALETVRTGKISPGQGDGLACARRHAHTPELTNTEERHDNAAVTAGPLLERLAGAPHHDREESDTADDAEFTSREADGVLSDPGASLLAMARDLPPELLELAQHQRGVVSRDQILLSGLSRGIITSRLRRGSWQVIYPGIYAAFSGELGREATLWAAVLHAGRGAVLSHQTAAELWGLAHEPSSLIHLTVPSDRRVSKTPGIVLHLSARAPDATHPSRNPPRTRLEETVIDLWATAPSLDTAVGWVTSAIGKRLTTRDRLRHAMGARKRVRWRSQLSELLSPDSAGIHSVLEYRYVRDVERPHRFPAGRRQAASRRNGRAEYRDTLYEEYQTVVELDGAVAHPGDTRWNDIRRDNAAVTAGLSTLRYGWRDVTITPCAVAAEIALVLAAQGYSGARPCSPTCPVGRSMRRPPPAAPRAGTRQGSADVFMPEAG